MVTPRPGDINLIVPVRSERKTLVVARGMGSFGLPKPQLSV
jgi:hypothetical protein